MPWKYVGMVHTVQRFKEVNYLILAEKWRQNTPIQKRRYDLMCFDIAVGVPPSVMGVYAKTAAAATTTATTTSTTTTKLSRRKQ